MGRDIWFSREKNIKGITFSPLNYKYYPPIWAYLTE